MTDCGLGAGEDDMVEAYHLFVGGGYGEGRGIGRELIRNVPVTELPSRIELVIHAFLELRDAAETFRAWVLRNPTEQLLSFLEQASVTA